MSPPAVASSASLAARTGSRPGQDRPALLSVEVLTREAHKVMADLDMEIRPARLSRLIRRFRKLGRSDVDFRDWFIGHADPTGETAIRRVMTERGF